MKPRLFLFILSCILLGAPQQSKAQFWKKLFGTEEKKKSKKKPATKPKEKPAVEAGKKKRKTLEYPASKVKTRYRIDVLVPLYLDELVQNNKVTFKDRKVPEKAVTGLSFYEGIKLASDTLTALGYNADIFIHDITQKGLSPEELVKSSALNESDLIIGALQSSQIKEIADFAKKNQINFISAISPSAADVKDNLYFTMLQPTLEKHCERIKEAAVKKHGNKNILLLYRTNNSVDSVAAGYTLQNDEKTFHKILWNKAPKRSELEHLFDSSKENVIIMPVVDNSFAESIVQQLSSWFPEHRFEIYGMPSWKFISTLRKSEAYPNIAVYFTSPFYYDLTTSAAQTLASNHRKQFGGRMGEMVFRGYEVLCWYAYLLQRYGTIYNARQSDNKAAPFTKFEIKPQWNQQQHFLYQENEHLYIYRYQSGSFVVNAL